MKDYDEKEIKRNYYYMYVNDVVHDGCTEEFTMGFSVLYPLFVITGISFLMWLLLHWTRFKKKN